MEFDTLLILCQNTYFMAIIVRYICTLDMWHTQSYNGFVFVCTAVAL